MASKIQIIEGIRSELVTENSSISFSVLNNQKEFPDLRKPDPNDELETANVLSILMREFIVQSREQSKKPLSDEQRAAFKMAFNIFTKPPYKKFTDYCTKIENHVHCGDFDNARKEISDLESVLKKDFYNGHTFSALSPSTSKRHIYYFVFHMAQQAQIETRCYPRAATSHSGYRDHHDYFSKLKGNFETAWQQLSGPECKKLSKELEECIINFSIALKQTPEIQSDPELRKLVELPNILLGISAACRALHLF